MAQLSALPVNRFDIQTALFILSVLILFCKVTALLPAGGSTIAAIARLGTLNS